MKTALHHFAQTVNERIISELLAFWRAARYRLKAFFKGAEPRPLGTDHNSLIIFLHGYLADSSCWHPWMEHLHRAGHNTLAIDFGLDHPLQTIDELVDRLGLFMDKSLAQYGDKLPKIHLVGHSMGGVVAAAYALRKSHSFAITSVVALAAPLRGAKLARAANWVFSKCGKEMAPESPLLRELSDLFEHSATNTQFYYAAAKHDDLVMLEHVTLGPERPAVFPCNHMGIIYNSEARDWVEKVLKS